MDIVNTSPIEENVWVQETKVTMHMYFNKRNEENAWVQETKVTMHMYFNKRNEDSARLGDHCTQSVDVPVDNGEQGAGVWRLTRRQSSWHTHGWFLQENGQFRAAAPLVRVRVKFTVKNTVCYRRRPLPCGVFFTVILSLTRTSGAALNGG